MVLKENYLKNKLIYNIIILAILYFTNCFLGPFVYFVYPLLLVFVLVDNLQNGLTYIIFCLPFIMINKEISEILFFICVFVYAIKLLFTVFIKEKEKINKSILILIGCLIVYMCLPFGEYNLNLPIKIFMFLFVFIGLILIGKRQQLIRFDFNIKILAYALIVSAVFGLTYFISPYLKTVIVTVNNNQFLRYQALLTNTNVLAMFCEITLAFLAYYILTKKNKLQYLILYILIALIGCCTFSKTFLLLFSLITFVLFVGSIKKYPKTTLTLLALGLFAIGLLMVIKPNITNSIFKRFTGGENSFKSFEDFLNVLTTYRYGRWKSYSKYIFTNSIFNLIFGYGVGTPMYIEGSELFIGNIHNALLSLIFQMGLVGLILFTTILVLIFKGYKKENVKVSKWIILPILIICLILSVEDAIFFTTIF